jgi:hypothetical protein
MSRKATYLVSLVLLLGVAVGTAQADITSDLISHWKLDDGSGTTAKDSAGVNDGTLKGDATWAAGWTGVAVLLDGDDDYVDCGQGTVFNSVCRDVITLAAWVKVNDADGPEWSGIIIRGYGDQFGNVDPYDTFAMYYYGPSEQMGFKTNSTSPEWMAAPNNSASALFDGEWHHTASVYDGAEKVIYLDGEEIMRDAATGRIGIGEGDGRILLGGGRDIDPMVLELGGLIDDARIYNRALTQEEIVAIMENIESYPYASGPNPPVGAVLTDTWVNLNWRAGDTAVSHNVYLGDDFDAVSSDDITGETFRGNQAGLFYVAGFPGYAYPDGLVPGTTYYWRIDEVNDADPNSPWKGNTWNFSIAPRTAYNPNPVDGAEFVDTTVTLRWTAGYGAKLHTVYIGEDFDDVNQATGGAPQGTTTYTPGTLESAKVYYWRVDEFDGVATYKGEIWSFTTPGAVGNPEPPNGATDVQMNAILSWTPADFAASHEVYFGTDKEAVRNADTGSPEYKGPKSLGDESYDPGLLESGATYYWRVDEVDSQGNTAKGPLWSFTTGDFLVVDDFEGYSDDDAAGEAIWQTWIDGFGIDENGAVVGYVMPPYSEHIVVHGGEQSLPYAYDNSGPANYSEATADIANLPISQDWTAGGVTTLSLWFNGDPANAPEKMYVALSSTNGATGTVTHDDANAAQIDRWAQWSLSLTEFSNQGVDLTRVKTITIGFGDKDNPQLGGTGTMYFDDIRLHGLRVTAGE